jgi:hypothetical protein
MLLLMPGNVVTRGKAGCNILPASASLVVSGKGKDVFVVSDHK